jgi:AcrR family transcriptional regulator
MRKSRATRRPRGRPSAREKILDATLELIGDIGVPAITLEGAAARAGVSKGGLLYHFRFKEQLLAAANEHLVDRRVAAREAEAKHLHKGRSRRLKAYVLASVNNSGGDDQISARLLASGAMTAETADPIRRYFKQRFPPFADDVGFNRAALVHAATEGLWFMDVLGLSPFSAEQRAQLVKTILAVVDGAPLATTHPDEPPAKRDKNSAANSPKPRERLKPKA